MPVTVTPTVPRGSAPSLQPFYYASSLFVEAMRVDITALLSKFTVACGNQHEELQKPFELFKSIWKSEGWELVHLKVLDMRARMRFLQTVMRLLAERLEAVEHPLIRVGALFALYTFYLIQPDFLETHIQSLQYIPLTIDTYEQLMELPCVVQPSLRMHVLYIISRFLSLEVFHILPKSSLGAQSPRNLPHTMPLLTRDIGHGHKKKTGRPSQMTQTQRADKALSALETFVGHVGTPEGQAGADHENSGNCPISLQEPPSLYNYLNLKEHLRNTVSHEALKGAETLTMSRLQEIERHVLDKNLPLGDQQALERLKKISTESQGLLGLLQRDRS